MRSLLFVLSIAACGGGQKPADQPANKSTEPSCPEAVKVQLSDEDTRTMVSACEHGWSAQVRTCAAAAHTEDALIACVGPSPETDMLKASANLRKAEAEAAQAVKDAREAMDRMNQIEQELDAMNARIDKAVGMVVDAQNDADRASAKAKLQELQKQQADMKARVAAAKAAADRAERAKGTHVSKECMDNPLAKGCE